MKLSKESAKNIEQGRAIARGMSQYHARKERYTASRAERKIESIKTAAEKELFK